MNIEGNQPPPQLPPLGFVRLKSIIGPGGPLPISRTTFWAGVKSGKFPAPVKLGAATMWRVEDIRTLIVKLGGE